VLDESGSVNYKDYCQTTDCYDTAIASAIESVKGLDDEIGLFDTGGKAGWQEFSDFVSECRAGLAGNCCAGSPQPHLPS
jgi:hypothetical protein